MKLFKNFLVIWTVAAICSMIPFFYAGLVLGLPAYTTAAIVLTLVFRKELS